MLLSVGSLVENINQDGIPDGVYFEVNIDDNCLNVQEKHLKLNIENSITINDK